MKILLFIILYFLLPFGLLGCNSRLVVPEESSGVLRLNFAQLPSEFRRNDCDPFSITLKEGGQSSQVAVTSVDVRVKASTSAQIYARLISPAQSRDSAVTFLGPIL